MKEVLSVRSNGIYFQEESKDFSLNARLEVVIIHTDGKKYDLVNDVVQTSMKISESRFTVSPEMLQNLITDLQLHQKKLEGFRSNAEQLNSLVNHLEINDENDVIKVAERLYYEDNPDTKMDVPSYAYERVEGANKRRLKVKSQLTLYEWCKLEQENKL